MMIIYFLTAVVACTLIMRAKTRDAIFVATGLFLAVQVALVPGIALRKGAVELGIFEYDSLGILFFAVMAAIAVAVFAHGRTYLDNETLRQLKHYHAAFVSLCVSMAGAYFSNNVTATWVMMEATTLGSAMLIYHRRTARALEAAWKYVFVCSVGVLTAYLGILFLSIMLKPGGGAMSFDVLTEAARNAEPLYLKLAFVLVLTGYSCKMEFFPLYPIGVDANQVTPAPMSAFFSTAMVNMGFVSIFRIHKILAASPVAEWSRNVMFVAGACSLLVSAIFIIRTRHGKRLFAYSTVENMGIVLLILSTGRNGMTYAVFHVLMHSLVKSTAFLRLSLVGKTYGSYREEALGGYREISPVGSLELVLCLAGLAAIPPSALFVSEMYVFGETSRNLAAFAFVLLMTCVITGFLAARFMKMVYGPKPDAVSSAPREDRRTTGLRFAFLAAFFFFGLYRPQWFTDMIAECIAV